MWANIKSSGFKSNFSRRYYSSFVLKPCASEGFLFFCDCACSCVLFVYVLVCVQANAWTLYGMQSHSPLWLIMVSCLPSHFVTSLPFQSDNGHKCLSKLFTAAETSAWKYGPCLKIRREITKLTHAVLWWGLPLYPTFTSTDKWGTSLLTKMNDYAAKE